MAAWEHADIYGGGESEIAFAKAFGKCEDTREKVILQSKCGIRKGFYDLSKEHILSSVDGILGRLKTDYLDILLLHRPDALVEPQEVAEAFSILHQSGKVHYFGVSNHNPMQIELLQKYCEQKIIIDQLQLSITNNSMIRAGLNVNMENDEAVNRDGSVLDYSRLHAQLIKCLLLLLCETFFLDLLDLKGPIYGFLVHMIAVVC